MRQLGLVVLASALVALGSVRAVCDEPPAEAASAPPAIDIASLPVLRPGDVVTGEIEETDPHIETATLTNGYAGSVVRG